MSDSLSSAERDARIARIENLWECGCRGCELEISEKGHHAWLLAELRAALSREEEAKKDAERYQRLRAAFIADDGNRHGGEMTEEDFDAEVDRNTARSVSLSENG